MRSSPVSRAPSCRTRTSRPRAGTRWWLARNSFPAGRADGTRTPARNSATSWRGRCSSSWTASRRGRSRRARCSSSRPGWSTTARTSERARRSCSRPTSSRKASRSRQRSSDPQEPRGGVRRAHADFVRLMRGKQMAALAPDPVAPRPLDHAGWQGAPRHYDAAFGSLTRQAVDPLLDSAQARSGARTLDVASGPGYAATAAAARGARVAALDFSSAMVELARSQNPELEFREGDAEALPFPEGSFDAVVMNFGMLHLAQPERAVAEAFRVLDAGGKYAFTVWAKPEEAVGFGIILDAIRKHGNPDVPLPPGPPVFRFSDASACDNVLKVAGFRNVDVRKVPQVWRFSASGLLFEAFLAGSVRTRALLHAQSAPALTAIRDAVGRVAGQYENHGTVEIPMPAVLAAAQKP